MSLEKINKAVKIDCIGPRRRNATLGPQHTAGYVVNAGRFEEANNLLTPLPQLTQGRRFFRAWSQHGAKYLKKDIKVA